MKTLLTGLTFAAAALLAATTAHAGRNLEVLVRDQNEEALANASVCLGDADGPVDSIAAVRTDALGVALFEDVAVNGQSLRVNVTAPGLQGGRVGLQMMNNHSGTLEPPQMVTVDLPGEGATCNAPGDDPEPTPTPDPDPQPTPMPGGGGGSSSSTNPTPRTTIRFRTVDYDGNPMPNVLVCAGTGPGEEGGLFGRANTDANGVGSIPNVPAGGDGYRRVTLTAVRNCHGVVDPVVFQEPPPVPATITYDPWPCGVGAEYARPDQTGEVIIVVGAADKASANATGEVMDTLCPSFPGDPTPTRWELVAADELAEGATSTVSARVSRGSVGWLTSSLYDFEWEVSDSNVLEIVGSARAGDRITIRGKGPGTATITARLARPDGQLASSPSGSTSIEVTLPGGLDRARSIEAFEEVQGVFTHQRCVNCHVEGDTPKQGQNRALHETDRRDQRPDRNTNCTNCHDPDPAYTNYDAPYAANATWGMPPPSMAFEDSEIVGGLKLTKDICNDIKQTYRDRGECNTEQECALRVADHIDHDGLVIWSFMPGGDRSPASMGGHGAFAAKILEWAQLGGFCPE